MFALNDLLAPAVPASGPITYDDAYAALRHLRIETDRSFGACYPKFAVTFSDGAEHILARVDEDSRAVLALIFSDYVPAEERAPLRACAAQLLAEYGS